MELLVLFPLGVMIYTDLRMRYVRLDILLLFGALQLGASLWQSGWKHTCMCMGMNILLLFLWGGVACLFLKRKKKISRKKWQDWIGAGDLIFLLFLTPVWTSHSFVVFLLIGAIISLIYGVYFSRKNKTWETIPLVGVMGMCYGVWVVNRFIQIWG